MHAKLLLLLLVGAWALNFESALMSHSLAELDALDTSQLGCDTPKSHFDELQSSLEQWANIIQNQDKIPKHIDTLTQMKQLIKHRKFDELTSKLSELDLVNGPVLSEVRNKLSGLLSEDPKERKDCQKTLMKLCAYLITQMNSCRQQCVQNPVTIIKVKGKIDDLKIIQSGCQDSCQPNCDSIPEEPHSSEPSEPSEPSVPKSEESEPSSKSSSESSSEPSSEEEPSVPSSEPEEKPPGPDSLPSSSSEEPSGPSSEEPSIPPSEESEEPSEDYEPSEHSSEESEPSIPPSEEPSVPSSEEESELPSEVPPSPSSQSFPSSSSYPSEPNSEESESEDYESEPEEPSSEETETPEDGEESLSEPPSSEVPPSSEEGEETPSEPSGETPSEEEEETPSGPPLSEPEEYEETPSEPPGVPPSVPEEDRVCLASESTETITLTFSSTEPGYSQEIPSTGQYGFGFYFKWLTRYPEQSDAERFFLASLNCGDTPLQALYFSYEGIQFVSHDGENEVHVNAAFDDVEGDWTYVYFSYSNGKAVGVVQYQDEQPIERELVGTHETCENIKLVVGGTDGTHPSFQGQVYGVLVASGPHVFAKNLEQYEQFVKTCNPEPEEPCDRQTKNYGDFEFFGSVSHYEQEKVAEFETWSDEYSVSGWFKWHAIDDQSVWHSVFRLSSNQVNGADAQLGDRDLAVYVGSELVRNNLQFTTYTYTELSGEGNPNLWQQIAYEDQLTKWHYIYFGYNRNEREAFALVEFKSGTKTLEFKDIHHYVIPNKFLQIGQDHNYPSYSGQFYNFHVNSCQGSFNIEPYDPPFGYVPPPTDPEDPKSEEPEEPPIVSEEEEPKIPPSEPEDEEPEPPVRHPKSESESEPKSEPEEEEEEVEPKRPSPPDVPPSSSEEEDVTEPEEPEEPEVPPPDVIPPPEPTPSKPDDPVPPPPKPKTYEPYLPEPPTAECEATIQVTKDNAADILCALSEYLAQLASGHYPDIGVNAERVCFCLDYDETVFDTSFLEIQSLLQTKETKGLEQLVLQRRRN